MDLYMAERSYIKHKVKRKKRLALLLPGHNEELLIESTIMAAMSAGQSSCDIYVVDDNSSDKTREIALNVLSASNVLSVPRSGKAKAVLSAIKHFELEKRYTWIHVADADSLFCSDYFRLYKKNLNVKKYTAAVGFVQSMRGNWIAHYRCFCYTYGQHMIRRLQSWFGVIAVMPGPVSCFRSDIIKKLDFETGSLTEDFDLTLQIHRKKLGRVVFIPRAINYTQDPRNLKDFINQTFRWQRGFFQGIKKYSIGSRLRLIDLSIGYQMVESVYYLIQLFIIIPLLLISRDNFIVVLGIFLADFIVIVILAIFSAIETRRPSILLSLTYFYFLRFIELGIFFWSFVEVIILGRYKVIEKGWQTEGRRYKVDVNNVRGLS